MSGEELYYEMLWQAHQKEKRSNELQLIPKTFYDDAQAYIKKVESGTRTDKTTQQAENASRLLSEIFERRKQKIMVYVAYGKQIPSPAPQTEMDLYESAQKLLSKARLDSTKPDAPNGYKLRANQDIPEVILPSGRKVGPMEKDQVVEIGEKEDRMFLINNKICREL